VFYISYVLFVIPKILDVYCLSWSLVISRSQFSLTTGSIFFLPISLILPSASGFVSCVHFVLPSAQFFVFFMVSLALQAISVLFCAPVASTIARSLFRVLYSLLASWQRRQHFCPRLLSRAVVLGVALGPSLRCPVQHQESRFD
jgi:hypothetical protein